jgi:transcription antitermination protein NusB
MSPLPGPRRAARERALLLLYEAEAKDLPARALLAQLPIRPDAYTEELVLGLEAARERVDELVGRHAVGWAVGRMPAVDRSLLRLATFELLAEQEVPVGAVISEAVELAHRYSTEESGRFVNGVLSAVAEEVRPPDERCEAGQPSSL